jgi:hypothetical protein
MKTLFTLCALLASLVLCRSTPAVASGFYEVSSAGSGRIAPMKLQTAFWRYHVLFDTATPLAPTAVVAIASRGTVEGDNFVVMEFVPDATGTSWTCWSWKNVEDWRSCLRQISADRQLNGEAVAQWDVDIFGSIALPGTPRTELMMGLAVDDPLTAAIRQAVEPSAILDLLKNMGYPVGLSEFETVNWRSAAVRDGFLTVLSRTALLHASGAVSHTSATDGIKDLLEVIDAISPVTFPEPAGPYVPPVDPPASQDTTLPGVPWIIDDDGQFADGSSPCYRVLVFHYPVDPQYVRPPTTTQNPVCTPFYRGPDRNLPGGVAATNSCFSKICTRYERRISRRLPPNNPWCLPVTEMTIDVEQCRAVSYVVGLGVPWGLPGPIGRPLPPEIAPPGDMKIGDITAHPWQPCPW